MAVFLLGVFVATIGRKGKGHRRQQNPAGVAMAAKITAS
jgi:hypothetical protein